MREAIVGYSFGVKKGHTISNIDLGKVVEKLYKEKMIVILQSEVAACVKIKKDLVVRQKNGYLDTEDVTRQASALLKKKKINRVWVVAQPFLHRRKCIQLLKKEGFTVIVPETGKIRFDPESGQWWTRNKFNFFIYAVLQKTTGRKGR